MGEVGELLIRIAFETDAAGAQKAITSLKGVQGEMEKTSDASKDVEKNSRQSFRSMARDINQSTRPFMIAGMAIVNLGMVLGQTGVVSQETAGQIALLGGSISAGTTVIHLASAGIQAYGSATTMAAEGTKMLGIAMTTAMPIIATITVAIAALVFLWGVYQQKQKEANGEFQDFADVLKSSGDIQDFDKNLQAWAKNMDYLNRETKDFKEHMIATVPLIAEWESANNYLKEYGKNLTKAKNGLADADKKLDQITSNQVKWNKAISDSKDLQEEVEDGVRSLARAQFSLNQLTAKKGTSDKALSDAGIMYRMGRMSLETYNQIKAENEDIALSIEEGRDAIEDQKVENDKNVILLAEAKKTISTMTSEYGTIDKLTATINDTTAEKLGWEDSIANIEKNISLTSDWITEIQAKNPGLIVAWSSLATFSKEMAENFDKAKRASIAMEEAKATTPERPTTQSQALIGFVQQGTPYIPRTGPYLLHKGEAVIPANQNAYSDSINIRNLQLSKGYGMDSFMKDRDKAIRIKRKMLGYTS